MPMKTENSIPFFSIIMPIYHAERYLDRCILSIKSQSFTDYEFVLVDDGSTDSSPAICQRHAADDSRYRYVRKENGGSFQARRFGVHLARGKYVMFMDADDFYVRKDALSILYRELKDEKLDAIQFGYLKQYRHLRRKGVTVAEAFTLDATDFKNREYPKLLCSFYDGAHLTTNLWNKAYHSSLFCGLPSFDGEARIFMGDDEILNLYLLENCGAFRFIPEVLYGYQQGSGGTSAFSKTAMRDLDAIKRYQLQFLEKSRRAGRENIEKILYSEVAGWFYIHVQESLDHLDEGEVVRLVEDALKQKTFLSAREYYLHRSKENWPAVNLLRKADSSAYLQSAKMDRRKSRWKRKARKAAKKVYSLL